MFIKSAFVLFVTAGALMHTASATPVSNADLGARAGPWGNLYVCTDANWSGNCDNIWYEHAKCVVLPEEFQNDISSIGPPQRWYCKGYTDYNCADDFIDFDYPGIYDLGDGNTAYNDRINSFVCLDRGSE